MVQPWAEELEKYSHFLRGTSYIKCHGLTECLDLVYYKCLSLMFPLRNGMTFVFRNWGSSNFAKCMKVDLCGNI